ncbi:ATP-binding protein [Actinocorallia lasiicapitis]
MSVLRSGDLPEETTGFVGRQEETERLIRLLGMARLVTVLGPGGVGKTRLALRVARTVQGRYELGVCLVELSALRDPKLLAHTVMKALDLVDQAGQTPLQVVLDHLRDRSVLLVLDTCEHLVDACAELADLLLRHSADVSVIATSRQPLDVPGEHPFTVPPLPLPHADDPGPADSVVLFAQRAAAVLPGFEVTDRNRDQIIELCRRLDGIPLAIELAAVRLRAIPLRELASRLDHRFQVLTGGRRALPRHQTLRTTIDWSYDLCTAAEQRLWTRLSVFAGPFDLSTAEEVCADGLLPRGLIVQTLAGLVDKSVLLRTAGDRYRLLDTIREYGQDRLLDPEQVQRRHIARYVRIATAFADRFTDDDQLETYRAISGDHANLRAALEYALALPGAEAEAAELLASLWGYWQISCRYAESRYWFTRVLELPGVPPRWRAWALGVRAYTGTFQGELSGALADLDEAMPIAAEQGDVLLQGRLHLYRHLALSFAGRLDEAPAAGRAAARRMAEIGDEVGRVCLVAQEAYLLHLNGLSEEARIRSEEGLELLGRDSGERWLSGYFDFIRSVAAFRNGDQEACATFGRSALRTKHDLGDKVGLAYSLETVGWLAAAQARWERAAFLLGAADRLWRASGARLSGNPIMEELHMEAELATRDALGEPSYQQVFRQGSLCPVGGAVAVAVDDRDQGADQPEGGLTAREQEIATLIARGLSDQEIAEELFISRTTVDGHVERILAKLGVTRRQDVPTRL